MKAEEFWEMGQLEERICRARGKLYQNRDGWFSDSRGRLSHMLHILVLPGYHQMAEITEAFGLEHTELGLNEDEWEGAKKRMREIQSNWLRDLHTRLDAPPEISLHLEYDPAGNFGLMISVEGEIFPDSTRKTGPDFSYSSAIAHS